MERHKEVPDEERRSRWKQKLTASIGAMVISLGGMPSDTVQPAPHRAPYTSIAHEGGVCPPNTQFGVKHVNGAGQNTISEFSAWVTGHMLGGDFDECEAALNFGDKYDPRLNAEQLDLFIETNHLEGVVLIAQSFGGIAIVDMLREYNNIRPDSTTKFSIIFISSPSGIDDLKPSSWVAANALSTMPLGKEAIYALTWFGTALQGGNDPSSEQFKTDVRANADATPGILLNQQMQRIKTGMNRLPDGMNVQAYYIGDSQDSTVRVLQAPGNIETAAGIKITTVYQVNHPEGMDKLGNHADLWWLPYSIVYQDAIRDSISASVAGMGLSPKAPEPQCNPAKSNIGARIGYAVCA